jgi:hypothetical protein
MNATINRWQEDATTIKSLNTYWNDKLDVIDGRLQLEEGNQPRKYGSSVIVRPIILADYLETLITDTSKDAFFSLAQQPNPSAGYYEKIADFKSKYKCLYLCLSELEFTFRQHDCNNGEYSARYSQLCHLAHALLEVIKKYKAGLQKPPRHERPAKHITYNKRTNLKTIKWSYPLRVPISETVAAAHEALRFSQAQTGESLTARSVQMIAEQPSMAPSVIVMGILSAAKTIAWDPLEWVYQKEITTPSPLQYLLDASKPFDTHMQAYQSFCKQILKRPVITEEVVKAFEELAPHAKLLDLQRAIPSSEDIRELAPYIEADKRPRAIPLSTYLETMHRLCNQKNIEFSTLSNVRSHYQSYSDLYFHLSRKKNKTHSVESFLEDITDRMEKKSIRERPRAIEPKIIPQLVIKLLAAAFSSPACHKIALSKELLELPFVNELLAQHLYSLKKDQYATKTYKREATV